MVTNDLFRLVSLRQPGAVGNNGGATPADPTDPPRRLPDPRLRHLTLSKDQAALDPSDRELRLKELKKQQVAASQRVSDLETVQRAVVKAAAIEGAAGGRVSGTAAARRLRGQVEARLTAPQTALFRKAADRFGAVADLDDLISGLVVDAHIGDANRLCAEIRAIEEDLSEGLPTVAGGPASGARPFVVAAGWGDLIVARESLVGYTAREIAHIENVLPGETKLREHSRLSKTEDVSETETTTEKESEKDSQTTDRYELQTESQEAINRDFSVKAGLNVSAKYGVTTINASLDTAFSQSESQSRSSSMETAREIVTKAVERTFERVRKLRRLTITEELRELNRHELVNIAGAAPAEPLSGMYLWVEKIQRIELRHYGKRVMVEFHIPEPALSLFEEAAGGGKPSRRLPAFDVAPSDVQPGNYLCLAQRYGASDVEPPPAYYINVGWSWVSELNEDVDEFAEAQFSDAINVPAGYWPRQARVLWSALQGTNSTIGFNFAFAVGGASVNVEHIVATPNPPVTLPLPIGPWPQGVPVSGRLHGAWDGAMHVHVWLTCERTAEAMASWQLRTWEALRAGYQTLERKLAQEEQQREMDRQLLGPAINEGPAAENRRVERNELQKWAIKSMRGVPQNFNAVEAAGDRQEIAPIHAEAQAPIVRFYEDAFEWEHMSYFLYPYHWARRESWKMRTAAEAVDPQLKAFLESGAARVIVPVTPGYEAKVLNVLDPKNLDDELKRILAPAPDAAPADDEPFRDLWVELLTERNGDAARGSGTLSVETGSATTEISADSSWDADAKHDTGREIYIDGERYLVAEVLGTRSLRLDRAYEGPTDSAAIYATGSTPYGPPWTVNVPTTLVVLADNVPALKQV